jgi:hypothetical protein
VSLKGVRTYVRGAFEQLLLEHMVLATGLMSFDEKRVVSAHGPFVGGVLGFGRACF